MRAGLVAGGLIGVAAVALGVALFVASSTPEPAPAPAAARARPSPSKVRGPRCDPDEAATIAAQARAGHVADDVVLVPRAWLDRELTGVRSLLVQGESGPQGLRLAAVPDGSVADDLGLRTGDLVGEAGGRALDDLGDPAAVVAAFREQGVACARIFRDRAWLVRWYVLAPEGS